MNLQITKLNFRIKYAFVFSLLLFFFCFSQIYAQTQEMVTSGVVYNSDSSANSARSRSTEIRVPQNLITPNQGWMAARMRMGFPSTTTLSQDPNIMDMSQSNSASHFIYYDAGSDTFHFERGGDLAARSGGNFAVGDFKTVIVTWSTTQIKISIDGSVFTTQSSTSVPAQAPFSIGSSAAQGATRQPNSDYFWVAGGSGFLTDANAAAIHAFGNADRRRVDFPGNATFVWWANDDFYNNDGVAPTQPTATNTPTRTPTPTTPPGVTNTNTPRPTNTNTPTSPPGGTRLGDANGDGRVDGADFVIWLSNYYTSTNSGSNVGDFNRSGFVDGVDYTIWFSNFGGVSATNTPTPTNQPNATNTPTRTPTPTTPSGPTNTPTPQPTGVSGEFPCGKFPNANPGCMPVSFQSWFDNVPASSETMSVNYTPRLLHQHYECAVPAARANGQYLRRGMKVVCQFVRYNSVVPFQSSNSGWYRTQNQGDTYEQFTLNLSPCQSSKYAGGECKTEHVHTIRDSDMSDNTEMRLTPNAEFVGMGGQRHFLSTNWQTGIGYRSTSEFTARYWIGECGEYQRTIMKSVDKFMTGNEPIPTVRGTIQVPFETNGGCGDQFKTFVFLDPAQHVRVAGAQTGTTLMETNGHFSGNLTWDTTRTSNGIHSVLFINMEGTGEYVSASGVAMRYNVQN